MSPPLVGPSLDKLSKYLSFILYEPRETKLIVQRNFSQFFTYHFMLNRVARSIVDRTVSIYFTCNRTNGIKNL